MHMHINPVFRKELKLGVRSVRLPVIMLIYNSLLAFISLIVFYTILESAKWRGTVDYSAVLMLYAVMIAMEGVLLAFIVPAMTSNAISGERERQTLDILLTTRMTPFGIITGKLMSSMSMVILLIISSIPVMSIVFIFGGVTITDVLMIVLYLIFAAVFFGTIGIACSARFKKTTTSTVVSYGGVLGLCGGTLLIVIISALISMMQSAVRTKSIVGVVALILLLNPGMTTFALLMEQLANTSWISTLLHDGFGIPLIFSDHWIPISIVMQLCIMLLLLWRAMANLKAKK